MQQPALKRAPWLWLCDMLSEGGAICTQRSTVITAWAAGAARAQHAQRQHGTQAGLTAKERKTLRGVEEGDGPRGGAACSGDGSSRAEVSHSRGRARVC